MSDVSPDGSQSASATTYSGRSLADQRAGRQDCVPLHRLPTHSKLSIAARPTPINLTPPGELIPKPMGWPDPGVTPCCKTIFGGASNMSSTGSGGPVRGDSLRKRPASRGNGPRQLKVALFDCI